MVNRQARWFKLDYLEVPNAAFVAGKGTVGYVDGTETLREDPTAQQRADFRKASQKAFSTIVMAISTSQLYLVTSLEEPKDAWDALHGHYERDTLANKLMLKKQYFRTEMKEGTSIEAHMKLNT